jgi:hypothetical protein
MSANASCSSAAHVSNTARTFSRHDGVVNVLNRAVESTLCAAVVKQDVEHVNAGEVRQFCEGF